MDENEKTIKAVIKPKYKLPEIEFYD